MLTSTNVRLLLTTLAVLPLLACSNEFKDKAPESQQTNGATLDGRVDAADNFDERLLRLEIIGKKIREIVKLFKNANRKLDNGEFYTPVDLILDVNEQLKERPVEFKNKKFVRMGRLQLKIKELPAECRTIETRIETVSEESQPGEKIDGLLYSVRTCRSSEYLPILQVNFVANRASLDFKNENLRQALDNLLVPTIQANTDCEVQLDGARIGSVRCVNLVSRLSEDSRINFDEITFDQKAEIPFFTSGYLFEKNQPQAIFELALDRRLTVRKFKFEPIPVVPVE